jgi:hypothetical protein
MITGTFAPHPWWTQPFYSLTSTYGWLGWVILISAGFGVVFVLCAAADGAAWLQLAIRHRCGRAAGLTTPAAKPDPRDLLRAVVRGASIPELESAALNRARDLYGLDADLTVVGVENVATASAPGLFVANVFIRHSPAVHEVSA